MTMCQYAKLYTQGSRQALYCTKQIQSKPTDLQSAIQYGCAYQRLCLKENSLVNTPSYKKCAYSEGPTNVKIRDF